MIKIKANIDEVAILNTEVDFRNPPQNVWDKEKHCINDNGVSSSKRHNNVKCVAT